MESSQTRNATMFPRLAPVLACSQLRRTGILAVGVPAAVGVCIAAVGAFMLQALGAEGASVGVMAIGQLYPLVVGMCAVAVFSGDRLAELQGSTPVGFRAVQVTRGITVLCGAAAGAAILFIPLHLLGIVYGDIGWASIVTPVGGAMLMVLASFAAVSSMGTARAATLTVVSTWLFFALIWDPNIVALVWQRGVPLLVALLLCAFAWHALGNAEYAVEKAGGFQ